MQEEMNDVVDTGTVRAPVSDWTTAALAHTSVLLTVVLGVAGGIGWLVGPAVALAIYFGYRDKSRFVAFHAMQSCIYQVAGVVLYVILGAVLGACVAAAWSVSGALAVVLVGLLLMPFALLLTLLMVLVLVCAPFVWLGYGLYAAYQVYQGRDFRYRLVGDFVEREVKSDART